MSGSVKVSQKEQQLQHRKEEHQKEVYRHHHHRQQQHHQHQYESSSRLSTKSSVSKQSFSTYKTTTHRMKTTAKSDEKVLQQVVKSLSPLPKRAKRTYLATDLDKEVIGYVIPIFRANHEEVRELMEAHEEDETEEGINYVAMRNLFVREAKEAMGVKVEKKSRFTRIRESAERVQLNRTLDEWTEFRKKMNPDSLMHPPEMTTKPRGQTVWEGQTIRLHCAVAGWPRPRIAWYKNNVLIDAKAHPEKYTVESNYNMHYLEIKNCDFLDTAAYRVSALNVKGEMSCVATVVVKRFHDEERDLIVTQPHGFSSHHGVTFETTILDKFKVACGHEGETLSLGCTVIIYPTVKNYTPEVVWYKNGVPLKESKWVHAQWAGQRATLTLIHLNKEDEGMYTMRVVTKSGYDTYSAYVFVKDADVEVEGVPVAPLDVRCHDVNKDYVVVTWNQPAVEGSSHILGYNIERCEVGTHHWAQCNDTPVKYARFPVTGLVEGRSYVFRVTALNKAGVSRPSRISDVVVAMDPFDRARLLGPSAPWTGMIKFTEEDHTVGVVPGEPTDVVVTEATKSYVVLAWNPPIQRGHEGVMYYIEKCVSGSDTWQRVNTSMPVKSPRFALFDLSEGKSYGFRVRCCNSAGVGEASEPTGSITVGDVFDLPSSPGTPVATRNTGTSVVVSWEPSKDVKNLVGYYIEYNVVGTDVWIPCNNRPVTQTRFVCHGLTSETTCVFRVKAVNAAGYSLSSAASQPELVRAAISVPAMPSDVRQLEAHRDTMVLGWSEPTDNGGADIRGYFVDYRTVKGRVVGKWRELNLHALTTTSYKVENLQENVVYQFQVRAMNVAGVSDGSVPSVALECQEWTLTVPDAPVGLHVLEVRDSSMVILWEPPSFDGRSPINGYYLDFKKASDGEEGWMAAHEKANKSTFMKVTQEGNASGMEASNNFSSVASPEENNVDRLEQHENEASDDVDVAIPTEPPTSPNASTAQPEVLDGKTNATNTESNQNNITRTEEFVNSTTPPANIDDDPLVQNSTISPGFVNRSDIGNTTTLAPESRDLNENTTTNKPTTAKTTASGEKAESTNVTDSNNNNVTTTAATEMNTSATSSSPNASSPEATSETTVATKTSKGNLADKQASSGSSSDTGLSSESSRSKRNEAWGAVLGTAVVVSIVGLVAYVVLKRRHLKGFSHRKLVEDFPSDPVLRLDNSEPLDLNFGRSGYYNQGLHGDNIQMANIPGRQTK